MVRSGAITADQLEEALRRQVVFGGRLGTNIIELGYADADAVAQGLARLHRVPAALSRHLERHDPSVLELIDRELAAETLALPVAYSLAGGTRKLVVCMRDPTDRESVALLRRAAGLEIVVCVAAELVVYFWLERCYGVEQPRRQSHAEPGSATPLPHTTGEWTTPDELDESIEIDFDDDAAAEVEMPAELSLVELDHGDVERDQSQVGFAKEHGLAHLLERADRRADSHSERAGESPPQAASRPEPPCDFADTARGAEAVRDEAANLARGIAAAAALHARPHASAPPGIPAGEALERISAARDRDAVADAAVAYMRGAFSGGLVLLAKESLALGHRGFGGAIDSTTVESIVFPLTVPSAFQQVLESKATYRGPAHAKWGALQDRFFKHFRLEQTPREIVVIPVAIKERVVCFLYAHGTGDGELDDAAVADLEQIASATSDAYVRLIKEAKRRATK